MTNHTYNVFEFETHHTFYNLRNILNKGILLENVDFNLLQTFYVNSYREHV